METKHHGGRDQALYAFAREDVLHWEAELGPGDHAGHVRREPHVRGHRGERRAGRRALADRRRPTRTRSVVETTMPRTPCNRFAAMDGRAALGRPVHRVRQGRHVPSGDHRGHRAGRRPGRGDPPPRPRRDRRPDVPPARAGRGTGAGRCPRRPAQIELADQAPPQSHPSVPPIDCRSAVGWFRGSLRSHLNQRERLSLV